MRNGVVNCVCKEGCYVKGDTNRNTKEGFISVSLFMLGAAEVCYSLRERTTADVIHR
jgi:predicted naringenin-chalcone synthase